MWQVLLFSVLIIGLSVAARLSELRDILNLYKFTHNRDMLQSSSKSTSEACNRQYIQAVFSCDSIGNNLGRFLDEMAWAIILNRTIVVDFRDMSCFGGIKLSDWIPQLSDIKTLEKKVKCLNYTTPVLMRRESSHDQLKCCKLESIPVSVINFATMGNKAYSECHVDSGAILSPEARHRANILFNNTNNIGYYDSLGFLIDYTLEFSSEVRLLTEPLIADLYTDDTHTHYRNNTMVFGLHVRHQKYEVSIENQLDTSAEECLATITSLQHHTNHHHSSSSRCVVLLATDRDTTLTRLTQYIEQELLCEVRVVERDPSKMAAILSSPQQTNNNNITNNSGLNKKTKQHKITGPKEHGPWGDSLVAISDWYLLSHAQLFIGTHSSTFSILMANLVAAKATQRGAKGSPLMMLQQGRPGCRTESHHPTPEERNACDGSTVHYDADKKMCIK